MAAPPPVVPSKAELLAAGLSEDQIASVLSRMGLGAPGSAVPEPVGREITPTPSFVVKTLVESVEPPKQQGPQAPAAVAALRVAGTKVFINLCEHAAMPVMRKMARPGGEEGEEGVHVPLAVGHLKAEKDKAGGDCLAVDLVMHPAVIADCDRDGSGGFRHWLVQLSLQYLRMKHGLGCSGQYATPKLKYVGAGGVTSQVVRVDKPAHIQEVEPGSSPSSQYPATPLGLLAEAGALPQASTALASPLAGGRGSHAAQRLPLRHLSMATPPMEIRLASEDAARERDGVVGAIAKEAALGVTGGGGQPGGAGQPGAPIQLRPGMSDGGSVGLAVASSRRIVSLHEPLVRAALVERVQRAGRKEDGGEGGGGEEGQHEEEAFVPPQPREVHCTVSTVQAGESGVNVHVSCPPGGGGAWEGGGEEFDMRLTVGYGQGGGVMTRSALRLTGKGSGDTVVVEAPGFRTASIRLPFRVSFVRGGGGGAGEVGSRHLSDLGESGLGEATAATGAWDGEAQTLTLVLPRRLDRAGGLVPLPSSPPPLDGPLPPSFLALLYSYVEVDARVFEPDPGSRPWLLAQALASEDDKGQGGREAAPAVGVGGRVAPSRPPPSTLPGAVGGEEELPEDRFLKHDPQSMHFLQQREAERAARVEKDAAREMEPLVKEITYEAGKGQVETAVDLPGYPRGGGAPARPIQDDALLQDLL